MSQSAIVAEGLGKRYRLGLKPNSHTTFREALTQAFSATVRRSRGRDHAPSPNGDETFWALKDVSFEVARGEVIGFIGRNGAGKSTLLKILSRITDPTEGQVRIKGRVASLLEVGTGFHPELTGRENIYLNGSILGMRRSEIDRKFDEIVAFSEVERFLDTQVKHYSSGMHVRLAFAVAAHLDPQILIVDEVLAVGDAAFQKKCLGKMQQVAAGGERTVLFVSHNLTTIRSLCTRVIWLKGGRVIMNSPVGPAVDAYLSDLLGNIEHVYDLEALDRNFVRDPVLRICKVVLNDATPVRHGESLEIEIGYKATGGVEDAAFGLGFSSIEGATRVMSIDTDIPGDRFRIDKGDIGSVCLRIPELQLQPGRYFLDVGVRSGDNQAIDYLPAFTQIEVLPGPSTPPVIVGRDTTGGVPRSRHVGACPGLLQRSRLNY